MARRRPRRDASSRRAKRSGRASARATAAARTRSACTRGGWARLGRLGGAPRSVQSRRRLRSSARSASTARASKTARDAQLDAFSTQLSLAASLRRPAIIHCVRAHGALLDALLAAPALPPALVLHAYAGSRESAERLLREVPPTTKVYFGFSPPALRGKRAAAVATAVPADRLLVESDCHDADEAPALVREACATLAEPAAGRPTRWRRTPTRGRCARSETELLELCT